MMAGTSQSATSDVATYTCNMPKGKAAVVQSNEIGTQTQMFDFHCDKLHKNYIKIAKTEDVKLDHTY